MASACVNNVTVPPAGGAYGCFSPRISFSRDFPGPGSTAPPLPNADPAVDADDFIGFEFHLNDPVAMLPADELFSDGKLVPRHLAPLKPAADSDSAAVGETAMKPGRRDEMLLIGSGVESFAVSPKAPTCSSRWRELLRLKRQQQTTADPSPKNPKSLKNFLNRNLRSSSSSSSADPNLSLPLLKDSDQEPMSVSARLSLSSTSSGPEPEELARLSLDSENKPNQAPILLNRNPPRARPSSRARSDARASMRAGRSPVRRSPEASAPPPRCASVDSPRMNASGRVVFQGLGRSSSSPSTFNGGPRPRPQHHRGMERSYSANVRVTPVLNVPVCSLRGGSKGFGFGQLFSGSGSHNPKPATSTTTTARAKN